MKTGWLRSLAVAFLATLFTDAALGQSPSISQVDALLRAAKAEGDLMAYSSQPQSVNQRFAQGFTAKYGVKLSFVRLPGAPLLQRYASEAAAGNIVADFIFAPINGAESFSAEAKRQGWLLPITAADIPALASGEYPVKFIRTTRAFPTPVVGIIPWVFAYNTQKIAAKDVPKDWLDLLDPKWKGQIIRTHPRTAISQYDPGRILLNRHGETYFDKLREQNPRTTAGEAVGAAQALAAGEGSLLLMTTGAVIQALKDKGAPVETVTPSYATGAEMGVFLSAQAKRPNAARLAIHYAMTREGSKIQNEDQGSADPHDPVGLPKEYQNPMADAPTYYDQINKILTN